MAFGVGDFGEGMIMTWMLSFVFFMNVYLNKYYVED